MRLIKYKNGTQNQVILIHDKSEQIKVGDTVLYFTKDVKLNNCTLTTADNPIHAELLTRDPKCYRVQSIMNADEEWYGKFYATLSIYSEDNRALNLWRADQGVKPTYDPVQHLWITAIRGSSRFNYEDCKPEFVNIYDEELIKELEVEDVETLYEVEVNIFDWYSYSCWDIK